MPPRIGVDLGTRRIGIALSDPAGTVATPYAVLDRTSDEADARAVVEIANAEGAREIVLGYPLALDGSRGDAAMVTEAFAERLREAGGKVRLWDERLTTAEAEKGLKRSGVRGRRRRQVIDKMAAMVLLQSYLESKKRS